MKEELLWLAKSEKSPLAALNLPPGSCCRVPAARFLFDHPHARKSSTLLK